MIDPKEAEFGKDPITEFSDVRMRKHTGTQTKMTSKEKLNTKGNKTFVSKFWVGDDVGTNVLTPFSELLNSSDGIHATDTTKSNTSHLIGFDQSHNNSGIVTIDRQANFKDRPSSVIHKGAKCELV